MRLSRGTLFTLKDSLLSAFPLSLIPSPLFPFPSSLFPQKEPRCQAFDHLTETCFRVLHHVLYLYPYRYAGKL